VIDAAFKLMRHRFGALVGCVLAFAVPVSILSTIITASTDPTAFDVNAVTFEEPSTSVRVGEWISNVVLGLGAVLAIAAGFNVVSAAYLGERASAGESIRAGFRRIPALFVAFVAIGIVIYVLLAATTVLIFPILIAAFLGVKWALTYAAIVGERLGPFSGMQRSWQLTRGHWWRTFGTLLVPAILTFVLAFALIFGAYFAIRGLETVEPVTLAVLATLFDLIVLVLSYPLAAAVMTVLYYDLRVRNEGFDLQLLARRVGGEAPRFEDTPERPVWGPGPGPEPSPTPASSPSGGGFAPPEGPPAAS
jgi:hypothetical protein